MSYVKSDWCEVQPYYDLYLGNANLLKEHKVTHDITFSTNKP